MYILTSFRAVAVGTICKNNGCTYSYTSTSSDFGECTYHPGVPIFHEGLKFWSCCQKRTSDFAQFMAQKGCVYGQHKFTKDVSYLNTTNCNFRLIYYSFAGRRQKGSSMPIWLASDSFKCCCRCLCQKISLRGKCRRSKPYSLACYAGLPRAGKCQVWLGLGTTRRKNSKSEIRQTWFYPLHLFAQIINVQKASVQMFGTKVEITLPKLEPGSWSNLNFPRDVLPAAKKDTDQSNRKADDSDDEFFDLDDIQPVQSYGLKLSEMSLENPNGLDW